MVLFLATAAIGAVMLLARRGHVRLAGASLTALVLVAVTIGPLIRGQVGFAPFFVVVAVVVAAVTLEPKDVFVTIGLGALSLTIIGVASRSFQVETELPGSGFINGVILFAVLSAVAAMMAVGVRRLLDDLSRREREAQDAREQARQADVRARLIAENTGDLIALLDLEGAIVWASPSHQRLLDVVGKPEKVIGGWSDVVHHDDLPLIREAFLAAKDGKVGRRQVRLRRANGSWGWFEALFSPVPGEPYVIAATRDITELRALSAQLEASQKMEALGRLAGGVAHDFNNLLSVMQSCTSLIRTAVAADSEAVTDLDDLQGAIERATALTRQLLAFSRREVVLPSRLDLGEVLSPTVDLLRRLLGKDVEVRFTVAPGAWPVRAAASQLEQVLMNLSVNARDAMPQGGVLELRVEPHRDETLGEVMRLSVRDTGTGMSEETKARIFEPFFTTKPPGRGTGLGLATVYGVVRSLGGRIDVETGLGKGTEFRVLLPRAVEPAEAPASTSPAFAPRRSSPLVFVVDDEPSVRALMAKLLAGRGLAVRDFALGEEALAALSASNVPDVLVTDVMLPGIDGVRLAEGFLTRIPGLHVVLVSGFSPDPAATARLIARGARFLPKPFTPEALVAAVTPPPDVADGQARSSPTAG
ncbi:MAG: ATP-binding protein [Myxococcota bacterium]